MRVVQVFTGLYCVYCLCIWHLCIWHRHKKETLQTLWKFTKELQT